MIYKIDRGAGRKYLGAGKLDLGVGGAGGVPFFMGPAVEKKNVLNAI